jgi:tyrosyl-tRNA synthetase
MASLINILRQRGFIEQTTHESELKAYLSDEGAVTCYVGFDPTASSLHIGSLIPIMALTHMQRNGHRPIVLIGGGTGLVGDPSGKTESRKLLSMDMVEENICGIKKQLSRFIDFTDDKALLENNANWLCQLEYIPFLRDIGKHFSVNRMLKAEGYKMRLDSEAGLNFIEFSYMLFQAYDFLKLLDIHGCRLQMGGSDQWGNIVAGIDLIRRVRGKTSFGITFPLITTSSGEKMGKTAKGAVWLDPERTSPYEYYQYWINTEDKDVGRFLALFSFLPMDEIQSIEKLDGSELNSAKAVLAFEATRLAHGEDEALKAFYASASVFGIKEISKKILASSTIPRGEDKINDVLVPQVYMDIDRLRQGIPAFKMFHEVGLVKSGGESRRLIQQGGGYINDNRLTSFDYLITDKDIDDQEIVLRAGKKKYFKIKIKK